MKDRERKKTTEIKPSQPRQISTEIGGDWFRRTVQSLTSGYNTKFPEDKPNKKYLPKEPTS